jgi:hypothetical protein
VGTAAASRGFRRKLVVFFASASTLQRCANRIDARGATTMVCRGSQIDCWLYPALLLFAIVVGKPAYSEPAEIRPAAIAAAKDYCASTKHSIMLSEDRMVLCFDGRIEPDLDVGIFNNLKDRGLFVIRSAGGYADVAMAFANILRARDATVILYDYCLSACANYVLVASNRTYVTKNTIIAWHSVPRTLLPTMRCRGEYLEQLHQLFREQYGKEYKPWQVESICRESELSLTFFKDRQIDDRYTREPQTLYLKKMWGVALRQQGNEGRLFWMWNPKNHGDFFKSRITYESYPTEDEAELFASRWSGRLRLFYDPEE